MRTHYAMRSAFATTFAGWPATPRGLAANGESPNGCGVFDPDEFLAKVLRKAGSQAAMARALDKPTSRIAELFYEEGRPKKRRLLMAEGMALAEAFNMPPAKVSAEMLEPILRVCLRYAPKGGWSDRDVQRLAEAIEYGLELLGMTSANPPSQDAVEVAANAIARRLQQPPS